MNVIKVTAVKCSSQGKVNGELIISKLHLNCNLVGAINGNKVLLQGGNVINLGGNYYTRFRIVHEKGSSIAQFLLA